MTPAERMAAERNRIEKNGDIYITPCRMARLMDAASKIMNTMVKADTNICYEECNIILALVAAGIGCLTDEEEDFT
ncbi:hypothetical protein [uncultured Dysosmobacter sp.]|uniref:hypothetical protein n=1 Tax=uncultured Dysosmobacter sp. TaxID=2591384 RepID=UPI00260D5CA7|nr:hypothetical protein [uncultured Dysosmobacter sp.]